jgi:hypothetical protein
MTEHKWNSSGGESNRSGYTPQFVRGAKAKFIPRKNIKSFRDLDIYHIAMTSAIAVEKEVLGDTPDPHFIHTEGMRNCALNTPLMIAEAHGMRFDDHAQALARLEKAMQGCNKMVVYLELYAALSENANTVRIEELSKTYIDVRGKTLRLSMAWKKFASNK